MAIGKTSKTYGTEADLVDSLRRRRHSDPRQWVFIHRLRVGAGFGPVWRDTHRPLAEQIPDPLKRVEQTIDAWAMDLWPSHNFLKVAYEVKVSRQDFFRELEHPEKREAAMLLSNRFYFVVPGGLVSVRDIPEGCGLIYVHETRCVTVKEAPYHRGPEPTWAFISAVLRKGVDPLVKYDYASPAPLSPAGPEAGPALDA